jgi:Cu2+-exporting ATPase
MPPWWSASDRLTSGSAGVFYSPFGWSLRPEISALRMSLSSIIVALNAVSLRRVRL